MQYMFCSHKVADYDRWHEVFVRDERAQKESGLHLLHLLRDVADPNFVMMLFRLDDPQKAKAFTEAPEAYQAASESGVIGEPEVRIYTD